MNYFDKLPDLCYAVNGDTGRIIVIKKGENGYHETTISTPDRSRNEAIVDYYNNLLHVTKAQVSAMTCGSMFGWTVPGANPDRYGESGICKPI